LVSEIAASLGLCSSGARLLVTPRPSFLMELTSPSVFVDAAEFAA